MKDCIDRMTAAGRDRGRRQITRDQMGAGDVNVASALVGNLEGIPMSRAMSDMIETTLGTAKPSHDPYSNRHDKDYRY